MEQKEKRDFNTLNYWQMISNTAQNCKLDPKEAVLKFHSMTGFPSVEDMNLILAEDTLFVYDDIVKIDGFIVERFNGKISRIDGIEISDNMLSYLLKDCEDYLFGAENLK